MADSVLPPLEGRSARRISKSEGTSAMLKAEVHGASVSRKGVCLAGTDVDGDGICDATGLDLNDFDVGQIKGMQFPTSKSHGTELMSERMDYVGKQVDRMRTTIGKQVDRVKWAKMMAKPTADKEDEYVEAEWVNAQDDFIVGSGRAIMEDHFVACCQASQTDLRLLQLLGHAGEQQLFEDHLTLYDYFSQKSSLIDAPHSSGEEGIGDSPTALQMATMQHQKTSESAMDRQQKSGDAENAGGSADIENVVAPVQSTGAPRRERRASMLDCLAPMPESLAELQHMDLQTVDSLADPSDSKDSKHDPKAKAKAKPKGGPKAKKKRSGSKKDGVLPPLSE